MAASEQVEPEHWYPKPSNAASSWQELGLRAPFESVWVNGVDITDTVSPAEWPEPYRSDFYEVGWRPFTPAGVTPVWWSEADGRTEPTATARELRLAAERARRGH